MKKHIACALLLPLALTACAREEQAAPPQDDVTEPLVQTGQLLEPAAVRPEKSEIRVTVQSKTEILPVTLHAGQGYSIYITEEGWRLDRDREEGGILEDTWESTRHGDDAELKVSIYPGVTVEDAKTRFAAREDDFLFDENLSGDWGDPMRGRDEEDREMLHFMVVDRQGDAYVISWHYDDAVADLYGAQLRQMADTFLPTE